VKHIPVIAARELVSMFATPTAYALIAAYLFIAGFLFFGAFGFFLVQTQQIQALGMLQYLERMNLNDMVIAQSLGTFATLLAFVVPLLCMRAFAEERATGSIELLLTSPVTGWEVVLGKYLAVLAMVTLITGLGALFPALLFLYGNPEPLQTLAGLLTLYLYGAGIAALCCFVSALTRSQIVAAVVGLIATILLLVLDFAAESAQSDAVKGALRYLSTSAHFEPGLRGQVRLEDLGYFGAMIAMFLALCRAAVESLRWR
jgi:ABC-2 type transport system permease protein